MRNIKRIANYPHHPSQRGKFGFELYKEMAKDKKIWLLVGDLGFGMFTPHFEDFPTRCINTGSAEQALVDIGVGLALEGQIPFVFSVTNFILYRPFEMIRNYLSAERVPVKLVASGRDADYQYDGFSHMSSDAKQVLACFPNINQYWPESNDEIPFMVREMTYNDRPCFISLTRR